MAKFSYFLFFNIPNKFSSVVRRLKYRCVFGTSTIRIGRNAKLIGLTRIKIGENFEAGNYLWIEAIEAFAGQSHYPDLTIGKNFNCSDFVHIGCIGKIQIGENVLVGSKSIITDHSHGKYQGEDQCSPGTRPYSRPLYSKAPVLIGDNVFIGDNCVIQSGAVIGRGSIVAAGSVVLNEVPENSIVAGIPARVVRVFDPDSGSWKRP